MSLGCPKRPRSSLSSSREPTSAREKRTFFFGTCRHAKISRLARQRRRLKFKSRRKTKAGSFLHNPYCGPTTTFHPSANIHVTPDTLKLVIFHKHAGAHCTSRTSETSTTQLDTHAYVTRVPCYSTVADSPGCARLGSIQLCTHDGSRISTTATHDKNKQATSARARFANARKSPAEKTANAAVNMPICGWSPEGRATQNATRLNFSPG